MQSAARPIPLPRPSPHRRTASNALSASSPSSTTTVTPATSPGLAPDIVGCPAPLTQFLKEKTCYDILPTSFKIIVLDTALPVKKALLAFLQNGIRCAPLWDSRRKKFVGMLTFTDFINLFRYYYREQISYSAAIEQIDNFTIERLRDANLGTGPQDMISLHPTSSLFEASRVLLVNRIHRIALVDNDHGPNGHDMVVAVLTQYRILRYIVMNLSMLPSSIRNTLREPIGKLGIGSWAPSLVTVGPERPLIDVLDIMAGKGISAVPVVDTQGAVLDVFDKYDMMLLIRESHSQTGAPSSASPLSSSATESISHHLMSSGIDMGIAEALSVARLAEDFEGVHICTPSSPLSSLLHTVRSGQKIVHRFVIVESEGSRRVVGVVSLSDLLRWMVEENE